MVSFFVGALVGELGVKELFLDAFFPSSVYGLILVGTGNGDSVAESGF